MLYLCTRVSQIPHFGGERKHNLPNANGRLPEWLGIGLQNRGQQFESATDLQKNAARKRHSLFKEFMAIS